MLSLVHSYTEVVSPNMFNLDLWRISGHYDHYLENMFTFEVENQGFGLKVSRVHCPSHPSPPTLHPPAHLPSNTHTHLLWSKLLPQHLLCIACAACSP